MTYSLSRRHNLNLHWTTAWSEACEKQNALQNGYKHIAHIARTHTHSETHANDIENYAIRIRWITHSLTLSHRSCWQFIWIGSRRIDGFVLCKTDCHIADMCCMSRSSCHQRDQRIKANGHKPWEAHSIHSLTLPALVQCLFLSILSSCVFALFNWNWFLLNVYYSSFCLVASVHCAQHRINVSRRDTRNFCMHFKKKKKSPTSKIHSFLSLLKQRRTKRKWFLFGTWTQVLCHCLLPCWLVALSVFRFSEDDTKWTLFSARVCVCVWLGILGLNTKYKQTPIRQISHSVPYNFQNFNYGHSKSICFAWTVFSSIRFFFLSIFHFFIA